MASVDAVLRLSETFNLPANDPGTLVVEFIFSIIWQLLEATLVDEGLLELIVEEKSKWPTKPQEMEIDGHNGYDDKWTEQRERLRNVNVELAIEIIGKFLQDTVTSRILRLACRNM